MPKVQGHGHSCPRHGLENPCPLTQPHSLQGEQDTARCVADVAVCGLPGAPSGGRDKTTELLERESLHEAQSVGLKIAGQRDGRGGVEERRADGRVWMR